MELATRITQVIQRDGGSEVRIVAQEYYGRGLNRSVGVDVHRRESQSHNWTMCSDRPHPDWRKMSVDDYIKHGRSEMLQTVSPGEILRVTSLIGKRMSHFD